MNCINCGAPTDPKRGECRYCESATALVAEADLAGFDTLMKMALDFDHDSDRVKAVAAYARVGGKLTAGQIRAVLDSFDHDSDRYQAGLYLVPLATSRVRLLEIGDLFDHDSDRVLFFEAVAETPNRTPAPMVRGNDPGFLTAPFGLGFVTFMFFVILAAWSFV